jgi:transketolase
MSVDTDLGLGDEGPGDHDPGVDLAELSGQLRVDSVRAAAAAGSGHPTSSMSAADLMAVLIAKHLRYDVADPRNRHNDHLIFSKGHASPLQYAVLRAIGAIDEAELLTFRRFGSRLEGHPTPELPWIDVATGSLGQGLPIGAGVALAGQRFDRLPYRVWVLCGDSEMAEGSMWEAFEHAGFRELGNLCAIVDVNRLGQRGPTMHGWDLDAYVRRIEAHGWQAIAVDGHDLDAVDRAYAAARAAAGRPTAIVARTRKGAGVRAVEDLEGLHGKPLDDPDAAIAELGGVRDLRVRVAAPAGTGRPHAFPAPGGTPPTYEVGASVATRKAYGEALAALGDIDGRVVALDGEVANSTYSELFGKAHPERFVQAYIAEQQMVADAVGLHVQGWKPFPSTFAAFLTRAHDFVRMAAVSRVTMSLCGSHAGVSIGEDGPSQMGLEDLAMMRATYGSTVLYPCDANQTAQLVGALADVPGISYLRTTRGATPVIYPPDEIFPVGGSTVVRESDDDRVTVVAAGITVHEALRAADDLAGDGIAVRVVDAYSVKPIDEAGLREAAAATGGRVVTVEDHWAEGGLGDAVLAAFAGDPSPPTVVKLAVTEMPTSGTPAELLAAAGIDAAAIGRAVRDLLQRA